jgi:hypothetical protein
LPISLGYLYSSAVNQGWCSETDYARLTKVVTAKNFQSEINIRCCCNGIQIVYRK